jgi:hypothetical protein
MNTQSALVVDRDETRPDVIILSGLKDECKNAVRSLVQKCRAMSLPPLDAHVRRRPKKFIPTEKNVRPGGGNVNWAANEAAAIARSNAMRTGRFSPPVIDEDSAS